MGKWSGFDERGVPHLNAKAWCFCSTVVLEGGRHRLSKGKKLTKQEKAASAYRQAQRLLFRISTFLK